MGGPNKLLLPYGDTTVVGAVVRTLLSCGLQVVVVTGRDAREVAEAVAPAQTVLNPRFHEGLGTSIAAGVAEVPEGDHVLIALGDMPGLRPDVVRALVACADTDKIVAPTYTDQPGVPGHPVLFGARFREHLIQLEGDEGARRVIEANSGCVVRIEVSGTFEDVDTPDADG